MAAAGLTVVDGDDGANGAAVDGGETGADSGEIGVAMVEVGCVTQGADSWWNSGEKMEGAAMAEARGRRTRSMAAA